METEAVPKWVRTGFLAQGTTCHDVHCPCNNGRPNVDEWRERDAVINGVPGRSYLVSS